VRPGRSAGHRHIGYLRSSIEPGRRRSSESDDVSDVPRPTGGPLVRGRGLAAEERHHDAVEHDIDVTPPGDVELHTRASSEEIDPIVGVPQPHDTVVRRHIVMADADAPDSEPLERREEMGRIRRIRPDPRIETTGRPRQAVRRERTAPAIGGRTSCRASNAKNSLLSRSDSIALPVRPAP
jgi:hypothetical protein